MKMTKVRKVFAVYSIWHIASVFVTAVIVSNGAFEPTTDGLMALFAIWFVSAFWVGLYMIFILGGIGICWLVVKSIE